VRVSEEAVQISSAFDEFSSIFEHRVRKWRRIFKTLEERFEHEIWTWCF